MRRGILMFSAVLAFGGAAQTAAAKPPPVFSSKPSNANYVAAVTSDLRGGDVASVSIHLKRSASCSLRFAGPDHLKAGPFRARARAGFETWKWVVASHARSGRWRGTVACRQGHKRVRLRADVTVTASTSGKVRIASHARAKHSRSAPATSPQLVGGRGGGGYPDDDAVDCAKKYGIYSWCKNNWWISSRGFGYRNCTDFVAWFLGLTWSSFRFPKDKGDAVDWRAYASNAGLTVTDSPSVGDVAWWGGEVGGGFGHVAIVTAVAGSTVTIAEYNGDAHGHYDIRPNVRADKYLHPGSSSGTPPAQTAPNPPTNGGGSGPVFGVQNTSETPPDGVYFRNSPHTSDTSSISGLGVYYGEQVRLSCFSYGDSVGPYSDALWYVVSNVTRPTVNGIANAGWLNAHYINDGKAANQVDSGVSVCSGGSASPPGSSSPPSSSPPASPPPPPPQTWSETVGGNANTWTNYTNAGGSQGPTIPAYSTVQIACKIPGFRVADGNTWWYRIASSPWNNAFYVSADAFYNNGQTSGSLHGTPFVDGNVANC